jgi:hypothetical protein
LYLRVPSWCDAATLALNGQRAPLADATGKLIRLDREWKDGDQLALELPMSVRIQRWTNNRNTASISRGPLTYSLQIKEEYKRQGGTDAWPAWDIFPASPWNYGLTTLRPDDFKVVKAAWPEDDQPFRNEAVPVKLTTAARKIPNWTLDARGAVNEVVQQPVRSAEPVESVTLIPMGAARLRIAAFPVIDDGPDTREWPASPGPKKAPYKVSASHCNDGESPDAAADGLEPSSSGDHDMPRVTWWPHRGTKEWLQYDFGKTKKVKEAAIYWFDDTGGGQCRVPKAARLVRKTDGGWEPVPGTESLGTARNRWNEAKFPPVETTALRLEVELQPEFSGGVLEWRVSE